MGITFDTSLEVAVGLLREKSDFFEPPVTIVRQTDGRLTVIVKQFKKSADEIDSLENLLDERLGAYSSGRGTVLMEEDDLIDPGEIFIRSGRIRLAEDSFELWLVDKLMTNQDWLLPKLDFSFVRNTKLVVGYSIKGGVGRSLALLVFARHLCSLGKRVVLVDMDLESPGIGAFLGSELSEYGVTDWLVESIVDNIPDSFPEHFWFRVPQLVRGNGSVFCVPAWGEKSKNYVSKLGRAYLTTLSPDDQWLSLADRLQRLMEVIAQSDDLSPDIILIDARAGLHDLGSALLTRLGAEVMLFSRDEHQSWNAYAKLFEHLKQSQQVGWGRQNEDDDLRSKLKMVGALMDSTEEAFEGCIESSFNTWESMYDSVTETETSTFDRDDEFAPHYPTPIYFADSLRGFGGWNHKGTIREEVLKNAFGEFCRLWTLRLGFDEV